MMVILYQLSMKITINTKINLKETFNLIAFEHKHEASLNKPKDLAHDFIEELDRWFRFMFT